MIEENWTCSWLMDVEVDRVLKTAGRGGDRVKSQEITVFSEVRHHFLRLCLHIQESDFRYLARTVAFHTRAENILDFYKIILPKWIYFINSDLGYMHPTSANYNKTYGETAFQIETVWGISLPMISSWHWNLSCGHLSGCKFQQECGTLSSLFQSFASILT